MVAVCPWAFPRDCSSLCSAVIIRLVWCFFYRGLVETVDGAAESTANVSLGCIRVVEKSDLQRNGVLAHVDRLDEFVSGPVPHVDVPAVAAFGGGCERGKEDYFEKRGKAGFG